MCKDAVNAIFVGGGEIGEEAEFEKRRGFIASICLIVDLVSLLL